MGAAKVQEDRLLSKDFSIQPWVQEVLARSNAWDIDLSLNNQAKHEELTPEPSEVEQLSLNVTVQIKPLPRLPRNLKFHDSVWVPRILWVLEYAAINHRGPITAAKIAEILTEEGDVDVPNTNVARAFRDFRGKSDIEKYFTRSGKKYSITKEGSAVIRSLIQSE